MIGVVFLRRNTAPLFELQQHCYCFFFITFVFYTHFYSHNQFFFKLKFPVIIEEKQQFKVPALQDNQQKYLRLAWPAILGLLFVHSNDYFSRRCQRAQEKLGDWVGTFCTGGNGCRTIFTK